MNRTVLLVVLALAAGTWAVYQYRSTLDRAAHAEHQSALLRKQLESAQSAVTTVTQYVDRWNTIEHKGATIIKEVPRYVTAQANAGCSIPRGFVRLHDAAAAGTVPDPGAGDSDATPSGVALSAVASAVAGNYTISHANAEQLSALQQLLRDQGAQIIGQPPAP